MSCSYAGLFFLPMTLWSGPPYDELTVARHPVVLAMMKRIQAGSRRSDPEVKDDVQCRDVQFGQNNTSLSGIELVPNGAPPDRIVVYFHGGAHCFFKPNNHKPLIRRLALASPARYICPDYRLAPQDPFPAGLDDALESYRWVRQQNPNAKIAVAGDSAGGNLVFALLVKLAQLGEPMPCAAVGLSPWLMLDVTKTASFRQRGFLDDCWTPMAFNMATAKGGVSGSIDMMMKTKVHDVMAAQYFQDHDGRDPLVTPIYAEEALVAKFPPVLIHCAEEEALKHDAEAMVALCERAGVRASLKTFPDSCHVFQMYPNSEQTIESIKDIGKFLDTFWESSGCL